MDYEKVKLYGKIRDCDNLPEKIKKRALYYLSEIVNNKNITFCDNPSLHVAFVWKAAELYGLGTKDFWNDVQAYLTNQKQK